MSAVKTVLLVLVTIFIPPLGVFLVAGCGMDLFINILLTCLGYIPGHIHAFYLEYVFYKKKEEARAGIVSQRATGVYSERVQRGGRSRMVVQQPVTVPAQQGYGTI